MRRKKRKNQNNTPLLKGRRPTGYVDIKYYYEGAYLFFSKSGRVEFKYIGMLKKFLKKMRRRGLKGHRSLAYKLYVSLAQNYVLSKKSKNSRMGKGKGGFVRPAIKVKKFRPFIYSVGHRQQVLAKLAHRFTARTYVGLQCYSKRGWERSYS